jgi:RNA polymerase sigma-70 factor (ECF subfamily)
MLLPFLSALLAPQDDSELIRRLKRRDAQAMGELYDRFGKLVYAMIVRIASDSLLAEDLLLETFLKVWNRVVEFDSEREALGPWVATIARNHAIDYLRSTEGRLSQARYKIARLERPELYLDFGADVDHRDRVQRVRQAFEKLSDDQRRALDLAYFEGLSESEIAARLQQPLGTVKMWVRSALQVLRHDMTQAGFGGDLHLP